MAFIQTNLMGKCAETCTLTFWRLVTEMLRYWDSELKPGYIKVSGLHADTRLAATGDILPNNTLECGLEQPRDWTANNIPKYKSNIHLIIHFQTSIMLYSLFYKLYFNRYNKIITIYRIIVVHHLSTYDSTFNTFPDTTEQPVCIIQVLSMWSRQTCANWFMICKYQAIVSLPTRYTLYIICINMFLAMHLYNWSLHLISVIISFIQLTATTSLSNFILLRCNNQYWWGFWTDHSWLTMGVWWVDYNNCSCWLLVKALITIRSVSISAVTQLSSFWLHNPPQWIWNETNIMRFKLGLLVLI